MPGGRPTDEHAGLGRPSMHLGTIPWHGGTRSCASTRRDRPWVATWEPQNSCASRGVCSGQESRAGINFRARVDRCRDVFYEPVAETRHDSLCSRHSQVIVVEIQNGAAVKDDHAIVSGE